MKRLLITLILGCATVASGATVFSNGSPDLVNAFASDRDTVSGVVYTSFDNFVLSQAATIQNVSWWGVYAPNSTTVDLFTISFYADSAGAPGSIVSGSPYSVSVSRTATGTLVAGAFDVYQYSANIPSTALASGTYWISIVNDTRPDSTTNWYWATSAQSGNMVLQGTAIQPNVELAFALADTAVVPEPSTLLLGTLGLAGIAVFRRRRSA